MILYTYKNLVIKLKIFSKYVSSETNKECNMKNLTNSKKTIEFAETHNKIHRKSQKTEIYYFNRSLDNFSLVVISPT